MKKLILAFAFLFVVVPSQARTITVDDNGLADFNNIQAAIDDANDGDEIVVADGVYTGPGNRDIDYNGLAITVRSQNGPANCIIDCNASSSDRHRGFVFQNGEGPNSVLSGLTIIDGYGKILAGEDFSGGGAILCKGSGPTIIGCIISGNSADLGGGVYCNRGSNPKVINCIFEENSAVIGGAFLCFADATYPFPELVNCTLTNNDAYYQGSPAGGGIALLGTVHDDGSVRVRNSIIWNNTPTDEPGIVTPICCKCGCVQLYVDHTVLQIDWQGVWYSKIVGTGNIVADPCFADPCRGDYHLKSQAGRWDPNSESWVQDDVTSPCIDAGDPESPIGWEPFPNGGKINMGAYGGTEQASKSYFGAPVCEKPIAGDINGDCKVDFKDFAIMASHWLEDNSQLSEAYVGEPGMTYQIGDCSSQDLGLSTAGLSEQTRFTATVDGQYIHFEDAMVANCCPDELGLEMTVEGELVTIYETELTTMPCRCICDYPVSATLGPFQPGTYTLEVYEDWGGFIGSTAITID